MSETKLTYTYHAEKDAEIMQELIEAIRIFKGEAQDAGLTFTVSDIDVALDTACNSFAAMQEALREIRRMVIESRPFSAESEAVVIRIDAVLADGQGESEQ
jgi:ABC-type sulfate transport system substrate-binding protein